MSAEIALQGMQSLQFGLHYAFPALTCSTCSAHSIVAGQDRINSPKCTFQYAEKEVLPLQGNPLGYTPLKLYPFLMQKVLIVTYYWPPAGGPGVQRWLKFVKYLPEFGLTPVVYVPENPHYPIVDPLLKEENPEEIQLLKHPIKEPYRWAALFSKNSTKTLSSGVISEQAPAFPESLLLWIRGNFFIPDARKAWVKPSIAFLSKLIEKEAIQTLITSGPPHSLHLIGLGLKKKYPLQWVADFRDPWTSIGYHSRLRLSRAAQKKHKELERTVLTRADKIVVTSHTTEKEFQGITTKPIRVITNGFDEPLPPGVPDSDFSLFHSGSLLTRRNPIALWKALRALVQEHPAFANALKIQLAGVVGEEVLQSIEAHGLGAYLQLSGYLPHRTVLEMQQKSQVLLLLEIDSEATKGIIPGKLFEYLNAGRPILALGPEGWEAGNIIRTTRAGAVCPATEVTALKKVLLDWFSRYQKGALGCDPKNIQQYHRRELTRALANFIRWELY